MARHLERCGCFFPPRLLFVFQAFTGLIYVLLVSVYIWPASNSDVIADTVALSTVVLHCDFTYHTNSYSKAHLSLSLSVSVSLSVSLSVCLSLPSLFSVILLGHLCFTSYVIHYVTPITSLFYYLILHRLTPFNCCLSVVLWLDKGDRKYLSTEYFIQLSAWLSMYLCFWGHYVCKTCTCTLENVCYPLLEQVCTDVFYDCVIFVILNKRKRQTGIVHNQVVSQSPRSSLCSIPID